MRPQLSTRDTVLHRFTGRAALVTMALVVAASCAGQRPAPTEPAPPTGAALPEPPLLGPPLTPATTGAATSGEYRNLFVELGKSPAEVDAKVEAAYQSLFHGEPAQAAVMFAAGSNDHGALSYIKDIGHDDVRSEGMSYGMMVAVQLDRKQDFDALWNWARSHMYHAAATHPAHRYFSWQVRPDGKAIDEMPAPDGEEYFATALYFAAHRWGEGEGIYAYGREASSLLDAMKNRSAIEGLVNGTRKTTGVALFNPEHRMVRFTPDSDNFGKNGDHTDPSYHLPAFYELWALWGPEADRGFWKEAAQVSRDFFVKAAHPSTALTPDYANFDGTPKAASWDPHTADFRYDAWRTAMNWSMDAAWWARDPRQTELSDRLLAFFITQGADYPNTYTLDGKPTGSDQSLGLVATNAVAALAATHPRAWRFVERLWERTPPTGQWRYYDGMLYMLAMLNVSGKFRVYAPETVPAAAAATP